MRSVRVLTFALASLLAVACSNTPTSPTPSTGTSGLGGTWAGSLSDSSNGAGTLRLTLTDLGTVGGSTGFSGTFVATFADAAKSTSGQASGMLSGDTIALNLQSTTRPTCSGQPFGSPGSFLSASLTRTGSSIRGAYVYSSCAGDALGTLDVQKR